MEEAPTINAESVRETKQMVVEDYFQMTPYNRWEAHITTDKVIYRPLDIMFVEVLVIDSLTHRPIGLAELEQYMDSL